jgi:hypothetical protein
MQLAKYSLITASLLFAAQASEEFISVQYLQYDEADNRTSVSAPSVMVQKDIGTDYTLKVNAVSDAISGASQTYYDTSSGASAFSRGNGLTASNIKYGNIDYHDNRIAAGAALTKRLQSRDELTFGLNYSGEGDFYSYEASADYMHWLGADKNQAISYGLSYQTNEVLVECSFNNACSNPNTITGRSGGSEAMTNDVINAEVSFKQVLDKKSYVKAALFAISESGYLSNPYLNIVEDYTGTVNVVAERRPKSKSAFGTAIKYAKASSDALVYKLDYRLYSDDWGINSHTLNGKLLYQANTNWLLKFGVRYYTQTKADFYGGEFTSFSSSDTFASSDHRLADFDATTFSTGFEYKINEHYIYNLDFGSYQQGESTQGNSLSASYIVTGLKYKF